MVVNDYEHKCYDDINTEIAKVALRTLNDHTDFKVTPEAIENATKTRPICRFEEFELPNSRGEKIKVILDVCHNQPGFTLCTRRWRTSTASRRFACVLGMMIMRR